MATQIKIERKPQTGVILYWSEKRNQWLDISPELADAIEELQSQVKKCDLAVVSNRRELLIDFIDILRGKFPTVPCECIVHSDADKFLKGNL